MCIELLRYKACNHGARRFLEKCKFVRNAGCFEPICAYFFGERGSHPCQFPKVPGKVHVVEGWCSNLCRARNEGMNSNEFMGRTPNTYKSDRVDDLAMASGLPTDRKNRRDQRMAERAREENRYSLSSPKIHLYRHGQRVYREADDGITKPEGVPLVWPSRGHKNREQIAPALVAGPRPTSNLPQQMQKANADGPVLDDRSNRAFTKPEAGSTQTGCAGQS
ncbi:hypothetical protein VUR80DRAFT_1615 [Thermomyces stellatus]